MLHITSHLVYIESATCHTIPIPISIPIPVKLPLQAQPPAPPARPLPLSDSHTLRRINDIHHVDHIHRKHYNQYDAILWYNTPEHDVMAQRNDYYTTRRNASLPQRSAIHEYVRTPARAWSRSRELFVCQGFGSRLPHMSFPNEARWGSVGTNLLGIGPGVSRLIDNGVCVCVCVRKHVYHTHVHAEHLHV